jgi:capsule polysaccharide export protein KpsE/RkpR
MFTNNQVWWIVLFVLIFFGGFVYNRWISKNTNHVKQNLKLWGVPKRTLELE